MDFDTQTDKELAALAAAGNEGAFTELLKRYERPIFSLIYHMVRDRALAEDLAQGGVHPCFQRPLVLRPELQVQ